MGDVDDFFNRKQKKKKNKKKVVLGTDLFQDEENENAQNPEKAVNNILVRTFQNQNEFFTFKENEKDDEWIEPTGEQEFVIESVGGIKRLELEDRVSSTF